MTFRYRRLPNVGRINLEQLTFSQSQSLYFERHTLIVMSHVLGCLLWTRKGTGTIEKRTPRGFAFKSSHEGLVGLKRTGDLGDENTGHLEREATGRIGSRERD